MDKVKTSSALPAEAGAPEQVTYVAPAVVYEAPLEIHAGSPWRNKSSDPFGLFGDGVN